MKRVLIELHFLPCVGYFFDLQKSAGVILEGHENFQKQSFRNRCRILISNRVMDLVIPTRKDRLSRAIKTIRIDHSERWAMNHWRTIQSAYGKTPFFEYFEDKFRELYAVKQDFLWDFNFRAMTICLDLLQFSPDLAESEAYQHTVAEGILDLRDTHKPKKGGRGTEMMHFATYPQAFGNKFVPNLSVIDLLFNEGPNSLNIIGKTSVVRISSEMDRRVR